MPNFNILRESKPKKTFRVASVMGKFDLQTEHIKEHFKGNINFQDDWQIGLIVGSSGTGKTTIAKELFENAYITNFEYKAETILVRVLSTFSVLGILISIIGISAFSLFISQQRTKEIGIRKVNGATINEILMILNADFIKWLAIAFVIACPIANYAMSRWLENYAYKTSLSWWIFALAGITTLLITLITISWHTFTAARKNPVEALRYE